MSQAVFIPKGYHEEPPSRWLEATSISLRQRCLGSPMPHMAVKGVIGFCGPREVGKDATGRLLNEYLGWQGHPSCSEYFAKPLYECVSAMTGIPVYVLKDRRYKEALINWPGCPRGLEAFTPRKLLQLTGTELVRKNLVDQFWVHRFQDRVAQFFERAGGASVAVAFVTDVRYENEVPSCDLIVELDREGASYVTEHSSDKRLPDHLIDLTYKLTPDTDYVELAEMLLDRMKRKQGMRKASA